MNENKWKFNSFLYQNKTNTQKQNKQPLIQNEWSSLQNKQCNKIVHNK